MPLVTGVDEMVLLDASLDDSVPCSLDGCTVTASWRWVCADCRSGSLLCHQHAAVVHVKMVQDTERGKIVFCQQTGRQGTPLEMLPVIPLGEA